METDLFTALDPGSVPLIGGFLGGLVKGIGGLVKKAAAPALGIAAGFIPGGGLVKAGLSTLVGVARGGARAHPTAATLGAVAGVATASRFIPSSLARPGGGPPGFPGGLPQVPRPGAVAAIQRALPGGRSGLTYDPYDLNTPTDKFGRPVAVHAETVQRIQCPSGYVAVDLDGDGQADACVLKPVARAMGLWKGRPKPPISGYDARAIRRANAARKRVKKLASGVGFKCLPKGSGSGSGKGKKK